MDVISAISPTEVCASTQPSDIYQNTAKTTVPDKERSINTNANTTEEEIENPSRPKGIRFAILFLSILAGDFFVGYVRSTLDIDFDSICSDSNN